LRRSKNINNALGSCADGSYPNNGKCDAGKCSGGAKPVDWKCPAGQTYTEPKKDSNGNYPVFTPPTTEDTGIWGLLLLAINIMTAGVGIAALGGIIFGSIMYMTAGGSPERTKKANIFLSNVVLGIIVYALMYAFLNFLIPGGLFS
jgi:hypothetical protein